MMAAVMPTETSGALVMDQDDDQIVQTILDMYQDGQTVRAIQDATGRSRTTIYYWLNKHQVPRTRQADAGSTEIAPLLQRIDALQAELADLKRSNEDLRDQLERAHRMLDKFLET